MANNCKITALKFTLKKGSSVSSGTAPATGSIFIIPKPGFVVSASKFTHGTLPTNVSTCVFSDKSVAGQIDNIVEAVVTFDSGFTFIKTTKFKIDIKGSADLYKEEERNVDVKIKIEDKINPNLDSSPIVTFTAATSSFTVSQETITPETEPSNIKRTTTKISGTAVKNTSTKIATLKVESKTGYYINRLPHFDFINILDGIIKLVTTSVTRDTDGRVTVVNCNIMFLSRVNTYDNSKGIILLKYKNSLIPTINKEISNVEFGSSDITDDGGKKQIIISGTNGAEFDFTVTKDSDGSSVLNSRYVNATILDPVVGSVDAGSYTLRNYKGRTVGGKGSTKLKFSQVFPSNNSTILTTAVDMGSGLSGTTATFNELTNVRVGDKLVMDEIDTSTNITVTQINSSVECVLSASVTAGDDAVARFTRQEKYHINIYPKNDATLSAVIPTTYPQYTINQYADPVLKLTATVTGSTYTLSTYTAQSYTGKANSFPSSLSYNKNIPKIFSVSIVATRGGGRTFTTANNPSWSSSSSSNSDWSNSVYQDVTDSHGNVTDGNGGTHIEIFNAKTTTNHGATTATITADVLIKKWGNKDVTMNLNTNAFLTATL